MSFICACAMPQSKKDLQKFHTFEEDDCFCQSISPKYHTVVRYRYAAACPPSPNTLRGCVTKPSNSSISQYEYVTGLSLSSSPLCLFLRPLSISFFPPSLSLFYLFSFSFYSTIYVSFSPLSPHRVRLHSYSQVSSHLLKECVTRFSTNILFKIRTHLGPW